METRSNITESSLYTKTARWIDDHPVKYVALATLAVYAPKAIAGALADASGSNEPPQLTKGNKFHYGEGGGNDQLQDMYPETEFSFKRRGEKGPDVEFTGGRHPSEYPNSTWDSDNDYGDFKPNTESSRDNFYREIKNGKLPQNTQPLPYHKELFKLLKDHFFNPK